MRRKLSARVTPRAKLGLKRSIGSGLRSLPTMAQASVPNGFLNVLDLQPDAEVFEEGWTIRTVRQQHETFKTKAEAQLRRQQEFIRNFYSQNQAQCEGEFKERGV